MRLCDGQVWISVHGRCGDGRIDLGEECELGDAQCSPLCVLASSALCNQQCNAARSVQSIRPGQGLTVRPAVSQEEGYFGYSVVSNDDFVVAVSKGASRVHVFSRSAADIAASEVVLAPSVGGGEFGEGAALQGNLLVIGAPFQDDRRGAVFVFERTNNGQWIEQARLVAQQRNQGDDFGFSVAVVEDQVAVGVPGRSAVQIFSRDANGVWGLSTSLTPPGAGENDSEFGTSMAFAGDYLAVGSIMRRLMTRASRSCICVRAARGRRLVERDPLEPSDPVRQNACGNAVSVNRGVIAVACRRHQGSRGSVYVFQKSQRRMATNSTAGLG